MIFWNGGRLPGLLVVHLDAIATTAKGGVVEKLKSGTGCAPPPLGLEH